MSSDSIPFQFKLIEDKILFIASDNKSLLLYDLKNKTLKRGKLSEIEDKLNSLLTTLTDDMINKYTAMGFISYVLLDIIDKADEKWVSGSFFIIKKTENNQIGSMAIPFMSKINFDKEGVSVSNTQTIIVENPYNIFHPDHTNMHFFKDYILFGFAKGIPTQGFSLSDTLFGNIKSSNPFSEEFYDSAVIFEIYNKDLEFVKTLGQLDPIFQKYRLGYSYTHGLFTSNNDKMYFNDGFNNLVYVCNPNLDIIDSIKIKRNIWTDAYNNRMSFSRTIDHFFQLDTLIYSYVHAISTTSSNELIIVENVTAYMPHLFGKSAGIIITKYSNKGDMLTQYKYMLPEKTKFIRIGIEENTLGILTKNKDKIKLILTKI